MGTLDLVMAVSLSGRAEGPVRQAREAGRRGARLVTIGAPDSPLADAAAHARGVHLPVEVPGGHSRTAMWGLVTAAVLATTAARITDVRPEVMAGVADRLDEQAERFRPDAEYFVNPAKTLALDLSQVAPVVLGDGPVTGVCLLYTSDAADE